MEYRKLNIAPELIEYVRTEIWRNGIHCETAGDGKLMAPITDEEEKKFVRTAKRVVAGEKDEHLWLRKLDIIPGRERDAMIELAKCSSSVPFEVRRDGSIYADLDQMMEDILMGEGIMEKYVYTWDEAFWDDDDTEREYYTTSGFLWPYVKMVFLRDGIGFMLVGTDDEFDLINVSCEIPWKKWVETVVDALCERQREISGNDTPVYSFRTLTDPDKLERMEELNGTDEYEVLWCDRARWARVNGREFKPDPDEFKDLDKKDMEHAAEGPDDWDLGYNIEDSIEIARIREENRFAWEADPTIYFGDIIYEYEEEEQNDFIIKMRKLNIDLELVEFAKVVLDRDLVYYEPCREGGIAAALVPWQEEILIEDAMCERQRLETDSSHPVYSFRTMNNPEKLARLQRLFWGDDAEEADMSYYALREDEEKYIKTIDRVSRDRYRRMSMGKLIAYKEIIPEADPREGWELVKGHECEIKNFPK